MDSFREIYKNRRKKTMLNKIMSGGLNASAFILLALANLGKVSVEVFHPKKYAFTGLGRSVLGLNKKEAAWKKQTLIKDLSVLIMSGMVKKDTKKKVYVLTEDGEKFSVLINNYFSAVNQKWDGYLRMVFYDIPMKKSEYRRWLHNILSLLGYIQIQKSVFIGKHPLPSSVIEDISNARLDEYIYISKVEDITRKREILKELKKRDL